MKLDWKKLLSGLFIGVGMTMISACSNNEDYEPGGNGSGKEITEPTETGYLSVRLSLDSFGRTRALGTEAGRPEEYKTETVWLVLYGADSDVVEYAWKLDAKNTNDEGTFQGSDVSSELPGSYYDRFITVGKQVVRKKYKMIVAVNPPTGVSVMFEVGTPYAAEVAHQITSRADLITNTVGWARDNYFYMTNEQGPVDVFESDIKDSQKKAERDPKLVIVERGVAKVVMNNTQPVIQNGDKFINIKWDLDVTSKQSYSIRQMTYLLGGITMEQAGDGSDRSERYARDPNFSKGGDDSVLDLLFEYLPYNPYPYLTKQFGSTDNYVYTFENTMAVDNQYRNTTTRVVIAGNYIPNFKSIMPTEPINFYTFNGNIYDDDDMEYYSRNLSSAPSNLRNAMNTVIQNRGNDIFYSSTIKDSFSEAGINYYKDGVCYYTAMIRHFDDSQGAYFRAYGRWGLVRNNVYRLTLSSINAIGSPTLDRPEAIFNDKISTRSAETESSPIELLQTRGEE